MSFCAWFQYCYNCLFVQYMHQDVSDLHAGPIMSDTIKISYGSNGNLQSSFVLKSLLLS